MTRKQIPYPLIAIIAACLILMIACKKPLFRQLPKATQKGRNIMGAMIGGEPWIADSYYGSYYQGSMIISGGNEIGTMEFNLWDTFNLEKIYYPQHGCPNSFGAVCVQWFDIQAGKIYYPTIDQPIMIEITKIDSSSHNRFISGLFSFDATNEYDSNDFIEIRDGRFDIKL